MVLSSSAAILTFIGFVNSGLITFPQSVAVMSAANLGTTVTSWLVAGFGFKINIAAFVMPMLGIGAFLRTNTRNRWRARGAACAGFGLLFIGIETMRSGMAGIDWQLGRRPGSGPGAIWILAMGCGVMTGGPIALEASWRAVAEIPNLAFCHIRSRFTDVVSPTPLPRRGTHPHREFHDRKRARPNGWGPAIRPLAARPSRRRSPVQAGG